VANPIDTRGLGKKFAGGECVGWVGFDLIVLPLREFREVL